MIHNRNFYWLIISLIFCYFSFSVNLAYAESSTEVKRTILALYDSHNVNDIRETRIHRLVEMPLNYLGLKVHYYDIQSKLPNINKLKDVRGVILWLNSNRIGNPSALYEWANKLIELGIRFVLFGNPLQLQDKLGYSAPLTTINQFLQKLGLEAENYIFDLTYKSKIVYKNRKFIEYERPLVNMLPDYGKYKKIDDRSESFLVLRNANNQDNDSHIVVGNSNGGFVDDGYIYFVEPESNFKQWYLNPFVYFEYVFSTSDLPKPDPSTHANRRIFYYHIDGDGWRTISDIRKYNKNRISNAKVIFDEVVGVYTNLPVTIAPIAGDLDPDWHGDPNKINTIKEWFALSNVEVANHTYSHPNQWRVFDNSEKNNKEVNFEPLNAYSAKLRKWLKLNVSSEKSLDLSRSYHLHPFSLEQEIKKSTKYLNSLLPFEKNITLLQWSGDMRPFERAIAVADINGLNNINGGMQFSSDICCSLASISPLGLNIGDSYQVYSSNYRVFSMNKEFLSVDQIRNWLQKSEFPRRLKPINYYHKMWVGENLSSLNKLKKMLSFAQSQEIIPVRTSSYVSMVNGFNKLSISKVSPKRWEINNRGQLQTMRFDNATLSTIDFKRSNGIIGQRHVNNSLYVYLDRTVSPAVIALKNRVKTGDISKQIRPFMVHGRWHVEALKFNNYDDFIFTAKGYGNSDLLWIVNQPGKYNIIARIDNKIIWEASKEVREDGLLNCNIQLDAAKTVEINIKKYKA